jgi:hypothetical protein
MVGKVILSPESLQSPFPCPIQTRSLQAPLNAVILDKKEDWVHVEIVAFCPFPVNVYHIPGVIYGELYPHSKDSQSSDAFIVLPINEFPQFN